MAWRMYALYRVPSSSNSLHKRSTNNFGPHIGLRVSVTMSENWFKFATKYNPVYHHSLVLDDRHPVGHHPLVVPHPLHKFFLSIHSIVTPELNPGHGHQIVAVMGVGSITH